MRRLLLLLPFAVAGCGRQAPAPPPEQPKRVQTDQSAAPRNVPSAASGENKDRAAGAADVLRRYYALIEAGRYDDAWAMRTSGRGTDAKAFAAHFKAYEVYHTQVGTPSEPVSAQGWTYVEVPVMTTGRFLGGKPFGSTGSVTVRRPSPGTAAPPAERGWRIYTG